MRLDKAMIRQKEVFKILFEILKSKWEVWVFVFALVIGILIQYPALTNPYVLDDDARQHLYWMRQFQDPELFQGDLLTQYAKNYQTWGVVLLYYLCSFFVDPILMGKILTVILFSVTTLYLFKLVKHWTNKDTGLLAAVVFMGTPIYMGTMSGGFPRSFGYPLLAMFLYYLARKEDLKVCLVFILQSLFYPMIFLISLLTYLPTFFSISKKKKYFNASGRKIKYFLISFLICTAILAGKYLYSYDPLIGKIVSRSQVERHLEFSMRVGRFPIFPPTPFLRQVTDNFSNGTLFPGLLKDYTDKYSEVSILFNFKIWVAAAFLFLMTEISRRKIRVPCEMVFLFLSGVVLFGIANVVMFKLFLPRRYLSYSIPLIGLVVLVFAIGGCFSKIRNDKIRKICQVLLLLFILRNYDLKAMAYFNDLSAQKDFFAYLKTLPKNTLIAAHPSVADNIPTFAKRKVFINYELSHPFYDRYWQTIQMRTFAFFNAYYSEDPTVIYKFCQENGIDYIIVNKKHFNPGYLFLRRFYFEPFNSYITYLIRQRSNFILGKVPQRVKLYEDGDPFVVSKEIFRN